MVCIGGAMSHARPRRYSDSEYVGDPNVGSVKCLHKREEDCGKRVKSSKKRGIWEFEFRGSTHRAELLNSIVSGTVRINIDGRQLRELHEQKASFFDQRIEFSGMELRFQMRALPDAQKTVKYNLYFNDKQFSAGVDFELDLNKQRAPDCSMDSASRGGHSTATGSGTATRRRSRRKSKSSVPEDAEDRYAKAREAREERDQRRASPSKTGTPPSVANRKPGSGSG